MLRPQNTIHSHSNQHTLANTTTVAGAKVATTTTTTSERTSLGERRNARARQLRVRQTRSHDGNGDEERPKTEGVAGQNWRLADGHTAKQQSLSLGGAREACIYLFAFLHSLKHHTQNTLHSAQRKQQKQSRDGSHDGRPRQAKQHTNTQTHREHEHACKHVHTTNTNLT